MTTEQLALVVTGTVGLGAPAIAAWLGWLRESRHADKARADENRRELRSLLDELLPKMFEYTERLTRYESWSQRKALGRSHGEKTPQLGDRRELYAFNSRLVIRRGREDSLVASLGVFLRRTDEALQEFERDWETGEPFSYSDEQIAARAKSYWEAYEAFSDECKRLVGTA